MTTTKKTMYTIIIIIIIILQAKYLSMSKKSVFCLSIVMNIFENKNNGNQSPIVNLSTWSYLIIKKKIIIIITRRKCVKNINHPLAGPFNRIILWWMRWVVKKNERFCWAKFFLHRETTTTKNIIFRQNILNVCIRTKKKKMYTYIM